MPARSFASVTPAEDQVLQQLLQGLNNRSIAAALVLSPRTVENHISRLLAKTGCQSRTQLLLWAQAER
jgi:DNA-binding NarL/FixJ family response regulator